MPCPSLKPSPNCPSTWPPRLCAPLAAAPAKRPSAGFGLAQTSRIANRTRARLQVPLKVLHMTQELEGGCLCGKVRFRTSQAPMRTLACHCKFCQRVTGSSYFAESMFPMDAVSFSGEPLSRYEHVSEGSKKKVFVHFCPNCGTTVSLTFERWPDVRGISRGCYDDPNAVTVSSHIWTQSAQHGTALPAGVDCFAGARMSLEGQPEPATRHSAPAMARTQIDA